MIGPIRYDVLVPERLTAEQVACWHRLARTDLPFCSPFLTPEFVRIVSRVLGNVAVGVMSRGGETVGFFPFQWTSPTTAAPVGGRMSDLQAVVADRDVRWTPEELLEACDLECWDFDHLLASQVNWKPHHYSIEPSPYLDLSNGFAAYCDDRRRAGSDKVRQILRQRRQLERELGPLRFEPHVADEAAFDLLLRWKRDQYVRTGLNDLFAEPWPRRLLTALFDARGERLSAMMAVLYAGDRIVAIDLGMRSCGSFHSWFIAYDRSLSRYGPGHVLTITIAEHAETLGISRFELGKGPESYKRSLASAAFSVAEGSADLRPVTARFRRSWDGTRRWIKSSPIGEPARTAVRAARTFRSNLATR